MSSGGFLWGKFAIYSTIIMGSGWALFRYTVPTEEQFYDSLAPDLKRKVDAVRAQRATSGSMRDKMETAGAEDKIVWGDQQSGTGSSGRRV